MKLIRIFLLLTLAAGLLPAAEPKNRDETVFLFQNRKVTIAVPEGLGLQSTKDEHGIMAILLGHPKGEISLQVKFLPDPDGRFATARGRKEFMSETFGEYVEGSVEKGMQFEELDPKTGQGTYCVFTDSSLVGKTKLPRGEFLNITTGLKTWRGVVAIFTLFSNDTTSKDYVAIMSMLRNSVEERPAPLL